MGESSASISGKSFFPRSCARVCACWLCVRITTLYILHTQYTASASASSSYVQTVYSIDWFWGFRSQQRTCSFVRCVPKPAAIATASATYSMYCILLMVLIMGHQVLHTWECFFGIKIYSRITALHLLKQTNTHTHTIFVCYSCTFNIDSITKTELLNVMCNGDFPLSTSYT